VRLRRFCGRTELAIVVTLPVAVALFGTLAALAAVVSLALLSVAARLLLLAGLLGMLAVLLVLLVLRPGLLRLAVLGILGARLLLLLPSGSIRADFGFAVGTLRFVTAFVSFVVRFAFPGFL
jgi:hypothetical protein